MEKINVSQIHCPSRSQSSGRHQARTHTTTNQSRHLATPRLKTRADWLKYYEGILEKSLQNVYQEARKAAEVGHANRASALLLAAKSIVKSDEAATLDKRFVRKIEKDFKKNAKCIQRLLQSTKTKNERERNFTNSLATWARAGGAAFGKTQKRLAGLVTLGKNPLSLQLDTGGGPLVCAAAQQLQHLMQGRSRPFLDDLANCALTQTAHKLGKHMLEAPIKYKKPNASHGIEWKLLQWVQDVWRHFTQPRRVWEFKRLEHSWLRSPETSRP